MLHLRILSVNLVELDVVAGEEGEEDVLHPVVVLLVDVLVAEEEPKLKPITIATNKISTTKKDEEP